MFPTTPVRGDSYRHGVRTRIDTDGKVILQFNRVFDMEQSADGTKCSWKSIDARSNGPCGIVFADGRPTGGTWQNLKGWMNTVPFTLTRMDRLDAVKARQSYGDSLGPLSTGALFDADDQLEVK
jgi:hypothetical protein